MKLTAFVQDPTVSNSAVEVEVPETSLQASKGTRRLADARVEVTTGKPLHEYEFDKDTYEYKEIPVIAVPWKPVKLKGAESGIFPSAVDQVFPALTRKEANGKPVLKQGVQTWTMKDNGVVQTNTFVAMRKTYDAATLFAGRQLEWGKNGRLSANTDGFSQFNAYYDPYTRSLTFGDAVFPKGDSARQVVRLAASREVVSHEAGHALHDVLKPKQADWLSPTPLAFGQWGESFGDQTAMWSGLQDPQFVQHLISSYGTETFNLSKSNPLSKTGEFATEFFGAPIRDAANALTVSDTMDEVHMRSEVLTGAVYKVFTKVYDSEVNAVMTRNGHKDVSTRATNAEKSEALQKAGAIMGTLLYRAADHAPENFNSMADVARAYLTADEVHFGGKYGSELTEEFVRRGLISNAEVAAWKNARQHVPALQAPAKGSDVNTYLAQRLETLIPGASRYGFGLKLEGTYSDKDGRQFIRTQLTHTVNGTARDVGNNGLLAFSAPNQLGATLIDLQTPFPAGLDPAGADRALRKAYDQGMAELGAPLTLTPMGAGRFDVVANWMAADSATGSGYANLVRSSRIVDGIPLKRQVEKLTLADMNKDHLKPSR